VRFLGVDLAWKDGNPSGLALLSGGRFPLRLAEPPRTLAAHRDVLDWIGGHAARGPAAVGVDAPLLGLGGGRRRCDDEISRAFGRFHASTHSPSQVPSLTRFGQALQAAYGLGAFGPRAVPRAGRPAIREVYPNALQVRLFDLDAGPGRHIVAYKRRRFRDNRGWAEDGLAAFARRCAQAVGGRYVTARGEAWADLVGRRPDPALGGRELKAIEDRWDALLCALAVAIEFLGPPGAMRFYPDGAKAWRRGFILAPALASRPAAPRGPSRPRAAAGAGTARSRRPGPRRAAARPAAPRRAGPRPPRASSARASPRTRRSSRSGRRCR
jgi:predicted RNase H-like nuclease